MSQHESDNQLRLSMEEWGLIWSLTGYPEVAKTLFTEFLGELNEDELLGRMSAAGNGLLARGIILPDGEGMKLSSPANELFHAVVNNDYVVHMEQLRRGQNKESVTYYKASERLVEIHPLHGIFVTMQQVEMGQILEQCVSYLVPAQVPAFDCPGFALSQGQLEELQRFASISVANATSYLESIGVPAADAALFVEDYGEATQRGMLFRINSQEKAESNGGGVDHALTTSTGPSGRTWLLLVHSDGMSAIVNVQPATQERVHDAAKQVMQLG